MMDLLVLTEASVQVSTPVFPGLLPSLLDNQLASSQPAWSSCPGPRPTLLILKGFDRTEIRR